MTPEETLIQQYFDAFNSHDIEGVMACFHDSARIIDSQGRQIEGKDEVRRSYETSFALFPDGRCDLRTLVVGAGTTGVRLLQRIQDHPETGYRVVGFLDDDAALAGRSIANRRVLGDLARLRRIVCEERVEEVMIAIPHLDHSRMLSLVLGSIGSARRFPR